MAKKQMRYFNGRCFTDLRYAHGYICAFSKAEAVRLGKKAFGESQFSTSELNKYWAECWGIAAQDAVGDQSEPGVYIGCHNYFFKFVGSSLQ